MRNLIMLRHAKAEDPNTYKGTDFERPLLPKGHESAAKTAAYLIKHDCVPDLILTSPYTRAKQTADDVLKVFKEHGHNVAMQETQGLAVGTTWETWKLEINKNLTPILDKHTTVMIVSHEPSMTDLLCGYIGADQADIKFRKGGLAFLTATSLTTGTLELLLPHQWI